MLFKCRLLSPLKVTYITYFFMHLRCAIYWKNVYLYFLNPPEKIWIVEESNVANRTMIQHFFFFQWFFQNSRGFIRHLVYSWDFRKKYTLSQKIYHGNFTFNTPVKYISLFFGWVNSINFMKALMIALIIGKGKFIVFFGLLKNNVR